MRNPFKKSPKPEPTKAQDQAVPGAEKTRTLGVHVFAIPQPMFKPGMLITLTEDGAEIVPPLYEVVRHSNVKLSISWDPYRDTDGRTWWTITWTPSFHDARGRTFGQDGPKVVAEVGLKWSGDPVPGYNGRIAVEEKTGEVVWRTPYLPENGLLQHVIEKTQDQISEIMAEYSRVLAFAAVQKKK